MINFNIYQPLAWVGEIVLAVYCIYFDVEFLRIPLPIFKLFFY